MESQSVDVPFFDFKQAPKGIRDEWANNINSVISSGTFIGGTFVEDFEADWATYVGVEHCVGVANGLDALTIALRSIGIGLGDRVAVPTHTFIASWLAILNVGAIPIGVDVDLTGQIDLDLLETLESLKCVLVVHMHGLAVDMPRVMNWALERGVMVIEDCAQAHGKKVDGRHVGSWGHAGAYSFYPTKNLGALGDAGAIVTSDDQIALRARMLSNYGARSNSKYEHVVQGQNSRLDPIQASTLSVSLRHLDAWNNRRSVIASRYLSAIALNPLIGTPIAKDVHASVWHHFPIMTNDRLNAIGHFDSRGIQTDIHYPFVAASEVTNFRQEIPHPIHGNKNVGAMIAAKELSIPLNQWMSDSQVAQVVAALVEYPG